MQTSNMRPDVYSYNETRVYNYNQINKISSTQFHKQYRKHHCSVYTQSNGINTVTDGDFLRNNEFYLWWFYVIGPMTPVHDRLGCEGQLVVAPDQELSRIDWLPISGKQISHPKVA